MAKKPSNTINPLPELLCEAEGRSVSVMVATGLAISSTRKRLSLAYHETVDQMNPSGLKRRKFGLSTWCTEANSAAALKRFNAPYRRAVEASALLEINLKHL